MRQTIKGMMAAIAVMTMGAAPALACGGGGFFQSSCSPCAQTYVSPCSQGYYGGYNYSNYYAAGYERLPDPSPQYYYVNQGPAYTGPGNFAPYPTYQESAVSGWGAYRNTSTYYGYDGGRYANATNHYYDDAPLTGPAVYSYGPRSYRGGWRARTSYGVTMMPGARYGARYGMRPSMRYGSMRMMGPRMGQYSMSRRYR